MCVSQQHNLPYLYTVDWLIPQWKIYGSGEWKYNNTNIGRSSIFFFCDNVHSRNRNASGTFRLKSEVYCHMKILHVLLYYFVCYEFSEVTELIPHCLFCSKYVGPRHWEFWYAPNYKGPVSGAYIEKITLNFCVWCMKHQFLMIDKPFMKAQQEFCYLYLCKRFCHLWKLGLLFTIKCM